MDVDLTDLTYGSSVYIRSHTSQYLSVPHDAAVAATTANGSASVSASASAVSGSSGPVSVSASASTSVGVAAHPGLGTGESGPSGLGGGWSAVTIHNAKSPADRSTVQFQDV